MGDDRERQKLQSLRNVVAELDGCSWQIDAGGDVLELIARDPKGREHSVCRFGRGATSDEVRLIANSLMYGRLAVDLIGRAAQRIRALETAVPQAPDRPGDFAANAAMMLQGGAFQSFLAARSGTEVVDKETADAALKALIEISSKRELNKDAAARERFIALRTEFDLWMKDVAA